MTDITAENRFELLTTRVAEARKTGGYVSPRDLREIELLRKVLGK